MKFLTKTQIFDKVAKHLLKQKSVSRDKYGGCAYRGKSKSACAVGAVIRDSAYEKELEGFPVRRSVEKTPYRIVSALSKSGVKKSSKLYELLSSLQLVHDTDPVSEWKESLKRIARSFNIKTKVNLE